MLHKRSSISLKGKTYKQRLNSSNRGTERKDLAVLLMIPHKEKKPRQGDINFQQDFNYLINQDFRNKSKIINLKTQKRWK